MEQRSAFPGFYNVITWNAAGASEPFVGVYGQSITEGHLQLSESLPATRLLGYLGDFYFRWHITTTLLDLGNLVSDQTQTITLWNAYRSAVTAGSITEGNSEGITLSGQSAPPIQWGPLQERAYTVGISVDGPASIDAALTWNFGNGDTVTLAIVGSRVIAWAWPPNWGEGIVERLEWRTDVMQAYRGEEQRRALRIEPRQSLEFSVTASSADRRLMEATLWNWGARTWALPLWYDGVELSASAAVGATLLPADPSQRSFVVGELVMLTSGNVRTVEVAEIAAVGSTITLARPLQQSWPAGTRVYPARSARIVNAAKLSRFTGLDTSLRLQWEMADPMPGTASASPTYRSIPVLEAAPQWAEDPSLEFERKVFVLDAGTGPVLLEDEADIPLTTQRMRYTLTDRAAIDTWRQRLYALRGKQGPVWVPTWADDMTMVATAASTDINLDVEWCGYTKYLQADTNRQDVRIQLANGSVIYRRILSASEVSSTVERLSLDSAVGVTINPADVVQISFMSLTRSDSDTHELAWFTGEVAEATFAARSFRHGL